MSVCSEVALYELSVIDCHWGARYAYLLLIGSAADLNEFSAFQYNIEVWPSCLPVIDLGANFIVSHVGGATSLPRCFAQWEFFNDGYGSYLFLT